MCSDLRGLLALISAEDCQTGERGGEGGWGMASGWSNL